MHKANVSGSIHTLSVPATVADPPLAGIVGRDGVTLVEYLRTAVAHGGVPGWEFHPDRVPDAMRDLFRTPTF